MAPLAEATEERIILRPQAGPQEGFLASSADIAIAGGAAGGGKTWALLLEPLRHIHRQDFGAVIFRRTYPQVTNEGGLWDESQGIYRHLGAVPRETTLEWVFPGGGRVRFAHLQHEKDRFEWKGAQIPLLMFDQLEDFTEDQFWYMVSRNRSMSGIRPYIRATCNPVPEDDRVGGWLNKLIAWWIDEETGYPRWDRPGQLRWFIRDGDTLVWGDSAEELIAAHPDSLPKSVTFVPARLEDNPALMERDPGYKANLLALPWVERERLYGGNWKVKPTAGKVFNRAWFEIVDALPADAERVRYWDKAGTEDGGDWSAGVKMARAGGFFYVEHVHRGQWSSRRRNDMMRQTAELDGEPVAVWVEQEPGSGGKESAEFSVQLLAGFRVLVDPVRGDKIVRAYPLSAQAEAGNVKILRGAWNETFLSELHGFPDGGYDDQVDAASGAFNKLALTPSVFYRGGERRLSAEEKEQQERERQEAAAAELQATIARVGFYWPGER